MALGGLRNTILRAALVCSAVFLAVSACHDSPTELAKPTPAPEPTQTPTATATPTPLPPGPAGLYGSICVSDAHHFCQPFRVVGAKVIVLQGSVTLQTLSSADGTYQFPIGGGLSGPSDCTISTIAPPGFVTLPDIIFHLKPGLNGPLPLQVWSGPFIP